MTLGTVTTRAGTAMRELLHRRKRQNEHLTFGARDRFSDVLLDSYFSQVQQLVSSLVSSPAWQKLM